MHRDCSLLNLEKRNNEHMLPAAVLGGGHNAAQAARCRAWGRGTTRPMLPAAGLGKEEGTLPYQRATQEGCEIAPGASRTPFVGTPYSLPACR